MLMQHSMYGDSEELLGAWFRRTGKRNDIFLASKFGFVIDDSGIPIGLDTSAEYVAKACDRSLQRLGVESIDLYYAHRVNPSTPIEETVRAMVELKVYESTFLVQVSLQALTLTSQGKIKHLGLAEVSSATLRRAHKVHPIAAVQVEYSAFVRDIESGAGTDLLATCRELGVAVVAYAPLCRGLLTGTVTQAVDISLQGDIRSWNFPYFEKDNLLTNAEIVAKFTAISERLWCTASQLALSWLLKQGDDILPIPGTKSIKYLEENWAALKLMLTTEEEREIRELVESVQLAGGRYNEEALKGTFMDTVEE